METKLETLFGKEVVTFDDVIEKMLEETFGDGLRYINSKEFKMDLKKRMEERGVKIEYKNMDKEESFGNGMSLDKYRIDFAETIDNIERDLSVMEIIEK